MSEFSDWLAGLGDDAKADKLARIFDWVDETFPQLAKAIKWNQPMYTNEGTFIIGFSAASKHFAFTPEDFTIAKFEADIDAAGYSHTPRIVRVGWNEDVDFALLERVIAFQIEDKAGHTSFWR